MLDVVRIVLLSNHLILVDVAMAGPLVCVWLRWREMRHGDVLAGQLGLQLARAASWSLVGGILLGVLLLMIRWRAADGAYIEAIVKIPRDRLWFALAELVFYFACMGMYTALWNRWRSRRLLHPLLAVAAASNLMTHFPALFTIVSVLMRRPEISEGVLDRSGFRALLVDGEVVSHVVHIWLSSLAVSGIWLAILALRHAGNQQQSGHLVGRSAAMALVASLLQIPSGLYLASQLSESARQELLGGDALSTALFAISLIAALGLMHTLAAITLGDRDTRSVRRAAVLAAAVVLLMVATQSRVEDKQVAMPDRSIDSAYGSAEVHDRGYPDRWENES